MSLISYNGLCELVKRGVITNVEPDQINGSSIDVTLGDEIKVEKCNPNLMFQAVNLFDRESPSFSTIKIFNQNEFSLFPNDFILAHTEQKFYLPNNISAEFKLKSSMARAGLEHLTAGWADCGFHDSVLTLELKNMCQYHALVLKPGMRIGQMVFWKHEEVPEEASYRAKGHYNGDCTVQEVKRV